MVVILDRGHGAKGRGTIFDPGVVALPLREVDLTDAYIGHAADILRSAGHTVHTLNAGPYADRHRTALALAGHERALYVQCHVNAGGGTYGLVEYDARSRGGRRAAEALARDLPGLPELVGPGRIRGLDVGERGHVCVAGIYVGPATVCGVIFEPGFIDSPAHAPLWTPDGLVAIGGVLAAGIAEYAVAVA